MQDKSVKCGQLQRDVLLRKSVTYLAKIAVVLQAAPGKMLTFNQLMDRLAPLLCEDRRSVENNTRVCLSTHTCFVKIPVVPNSPHSKRNYWKLDCGQITAKMVRRHFKGMLHLFPELTSRVDDAADRGARPPSSTPSPKPAAVQVKREAKFSSPFSIESLLKRDPRPSPLSSLQIRLVGTKRSLCWDSEELLLQASPGASPLCPAGGSTHHGLPAKAARRMLVTTQPLYTEDVRYFSRSYVTYPSPAFSHDALCFRL